MKHFAYDVQKKSTRRRKKGRKKYGDDPDPIPIRIDTGRGGEQDFWSCARFEIYGHVSFASTYSRTCLMVDLIGYFIKYNEILDQFYVESCILKDLKALEILRKVFGVLQKIPIKF